MKSGWTKRIVVAAGVLTLWTTSSGVLAMRADTPATLRRAQADMNAGRLSDALRLFEEVLATPRIRQEERARALYGVAMLRLCPDATLRDMDKARAALEQLRITYPDVQRVEVLAVTALLSELTASEQRVKESVGARQAELEAIQRQLEQPTQPRGAPSTLAGAAADVGALQKELAALRRDFAVAQEQLAAAQAELKKKDEALKRLTASAPKP
jgi:hypothetical protein